MAYKKKTKKVKRQVSLAIVSVQSSFNNTLVTVSTKDGAVLCRCSAGQLSFKGSRKGTPFAGTQIGSHLAKEMTTQFGISRVECNLSGPGSGRDSVVRALQASGLEVTVLRDVTPLPHNGCRAAKRRRV